MEYTKLPPVRKDKYFQLKHFPTRFHAAVFRLWETADASRIALALGTSTDVIKKAAQDMGLSEQRYTESWEKLGYITTIRNAWHILPYNQLLTLLGWSEEQLATTLKEDDFLDIKLGNFKPYCDPVQVEEPDETQSLRLAEIKSVVQTHFKGMFDGAEPFKFFEKTNSKGLTDSGRDNLRLIYSYCGLYASALDNDISLSYPDVLLDMYRSVGINAIWLPAVLYQLVPFAFDESYSVGWQQRLARLNELVKKAAEYGIKVYLYLNEPRCMPADFFKRHPDLKGRTIGMYSSLCTNNPAVLEYLRHAVRTLCQAVEDIGGFFVITCSENLTHCKSRSEGEECPKCKNIPTAELISQVLCAISEESRNINPDIRTIAWTWAWDDYMTKDEIAQCIDMLPSDIVIECNSEAQKEFLIGGITGTIRDYSMSIPGPAPLAEYIWNYAKSKGHEVCAKVQINVTWECSTLPFLPVFDLIREHMKGLKKSGVEHLMLSWTLGGYPSFNLKIASSCLEETSDEKYMSLLQREFGEYAEKVKKAATLFSNAFREFPFHLESLYKGPQNSGPANLLYAQPSGFDATMTCFAYDDIESWRAIYPKDVYISQLKKLSDGWKAGLEEISDMPDCLFKQAAWGGYALFYSSYLQAEFIDMRESGEVEYLIHLISEEKKMALLMYELMKKSSLFGYEAANHYYFNKTMLVEKILNCEYLIEYFRGLKS